MEAREECDWKAGMSAIRRRGGGRLEGGEEGDQKRLRQRHVESPSWARRTGAVLSTVSHPPPAPRHWYSIQSPT